MKGIGIILIFILLAIIFEMNTILWIVENVLSIAVIAVVVVLQPELRRALEELGRKKFFASLMPFDKVQTERFSDKTVNDLVKASFEMGKGQDRCSYGNRAECEADRVRKNRNRSGWIDIQPASDQYI